MPQGRDRQKGSKGGKDTVRRELGFNKSKRSGDSVPLCRWEFIKEKNYLEKSKIQEKKKENTLSTKKKKVKRNNISTTLSTKKKKRFRITFFLI